MADFSKKPDEAMRRIAQDLRDHLGSRCKVEVFDLGRVSARSILAVVGTKPDVIHYIPGPSWVSPIVLKLLAVMSASRRSVMSAYHFRQSDSRLRLSLRLLRPTLVLVESKKAEAFMRNLGLRTSWALPGVNEAFFEPLEPPRWTELRQKHAIREDDVVVLHVGHARDGRELIGLTKWRTTDHIRTLLVCSVSEGKDEELIRALRESGITVVDEFVQDISAYYKVSDIYVFPAKGDIASIDVPLSVMEAAAAGLRIVAEKFGGLSDIDVLQSYITYPQLDEDMMGTVLKVVGNLSETRQQSRSAGTGRATFLSWNLRIHDFVDAYRSALEDSK